MNGKLRSRADTVVIKFIIYSAGLDHNDFNANICVIFYVDVSLNNFSLHEVENKK